MQASACTLLLLILVQYCSSEQTLGKVVFASVLYRHGDRTPLEGYPNDPYKDESSWPVPFGQLTNLGKHQHLMLGRWLRDRYAHLLAAEYSVHDVYVMSTDVDRTLMSAEANLAGMYPPSGAQVWDIKGWMPIPVHTVPDAQDYVLAGSKFCATYAREMQRVLASPKMKRIDETNAGLYEYLSAMTGTNISSVKAVNRLYNTLFIEELYNKTLPAWTKSVYPKRLKALAETSFTIPAYKKILQRLESGPLLKEMIEHMQLKSKDALKPNRKLWIYSAHDCTIANMLMTLGLFEPHCPPYTATLLLELRIDAQNGYVVTIFYKNSTGEPTLLTLPGCAVACPLNQFVRLTKDVIPDDWERECSLEIEEFIPSPLPSVMLPFFLLSMLSLCVMLLLVMRAIVSRYDERESNGKRCNHDLKVEIVGAYVKKVEVREKNVIKIIIDKNE